MKKIYNIIFIVVGLILGVSPEAFAQTSSEGIVLDKHVTQVPDENGVRWITLESYVTGAVKVVTGSVPSDVILVLDVSSSMKDQYPGYDTRLDALKESVQGFIDSIYKNDQDATKADPNYDGNRIAILTYSSSVNDITNGAWYEVSDGVDDLKERVKNMVTAQGTRPDLGLRDAIDNYLDGSNNSARSNANLTVVLFTDGYPSTTGSTNFTESYASSALYYANQIKGMTNAKGDHAKLFTIGLITEVTPITSGRNRNTDDDGEYGKYQKVLALMDWMSSNYPTSEITLSYDRDGEVINDWTYTHSTTSVTVSGLTPGNRNTDKVEYFQLVDDNTDLSSIFEAIASQSGGSTSSITEDAVVEVDVVSSSFTLPSGDLAEGYEPLIYIAKCTGYDSEGKGDTFDADWIFIENTEEDVDNMTNVDGTTSHITIDIDGNEISTTGFDFSKNFCGRRYKNDDDGKPVAYADGYKLIVKIPIAINENAVGGVGTNTNEKGSGIKVNGNLVAEFPIPVVSVPVNLWVMKTGLSNYESAHFSVYRCPVVKTTNSDGTIEYSEGTYETTPYTSFILTGGLAEETVTIDGKNYTGPMIKLQGLNENYYYKVEEEEWSWQYTGMPVTEKTTFKLKANPVVFVNNINDSTVLHAESKVLNDFGDGSATTYSSKHLNQITEVSSGTGTSSDTGK